MRKLTINNKTKILNDDNIYILIGEDANKIILNEKDPNKGTFKINGETFNITIDKVETKKQPKKEFDPSKVVYSDKEINW